MRVREVFSRRTTTLPTCRKDWVTESGWEVATADAVAPSWTSEATRVHHACVHAVVCGMKLTDPGITIVPQRSPALDVCVASSIAAAASGDAAQAAFELELTHYRNELGELRQNIHYRPLVWNADGRPHPAATRTLQYAADIASSRNGQHLSSKSLHRRWKHEIQIALLHRRAATARALLPNPSARAEWLFAGIIDRALQHCGHVPALDGGPGDHGLDNLETNTAVIDDDDDIVSLASCTCESVQPSSL